MTDKEPAADPRELALDHAWSLVLGLVRIGRATDHRFLRAIQDPAGGDLRQLFFDAWRLFRLLESIRFGEARDSSRHDKAG